MMNEPIHSIMTKNVLTLSPDDNLADAREIMIKNKIHHLPVVNKTGKLVGIITSWDMVKREIGPDELKKIRVEDAMTKNMATLEADQHLGAVAELLLEHLFHAVPIVNEVGNLIGIVTTTDIIRYTYNKEYPENLDKFVSENM